MTAIERAIAFCKTTGYESSDHFRGATKMISVGKEPIAFAQSYFAVQTRKIANEGLLLSYSSCVCFENIFSRL